MNSRICPSKPTLVFLLTAISLTIGIANFLLPTTQVGAQEVKRIAPNLQGRNPHPRPSVEIEDKGLTSLRFKDFNDDQEASQFAMEAGSPEQETIGWQPTNGPYGGFVSALAVSGTAIFAGTSRGGAFVSTDQGASWQPTGQGVISRYVSSILVNGDAIYVGTDGERVYKSTDQGRSWRQSNNGLSVPGGYGYIAAMIAHGSTLYAGSAFGWIFVSTDQGESWTPLNAGFTPDSDGFFPSVTAFESLGDQLFVATNEGGLFRLDNQTRRWIPTNAGLPSNRIYSLKAVGSKLIAGLQFNYGAYISENGGQNWRRAIAPPEDGFSSFVTMGNAVYAAAHRAVYRSTDQGETWQELKTGLPATRLAGECLAVSGDSLFVGSFYDGVYRSNDGGERWELASHGLAAADAIALIANGANVYAGTMAGGGVQMTSDNGQTWQLLNAGLPFQHHSFDTRVIGVHDPYLFVGTDRDGVFRSTNGGQSWQPVGSGLPLNQSGRVISPSSYFSSGGNLYATVYNRGVYVSTDNGESWTALNTGLTDLRCRVMAQMGSTLFVGTGDFSVGGVFRSTDSGRNWVQLTNGLPNSSVHGLVVSGSAILAGTQRGVYLSRDQGQSWVASTTGIGSVRVDAMAIKGQNIFVGANSSVFLSVNQGESWSNIGSGLSEQFIRSLAATDSKVFVGTQDRGVFVRDLATIQCSYSISPTSRSISGATTTGTVSVTATAGCAWQAASNVDWVAITSGASGSGNGTVNYSVAANPAQTSRIGTATIAGQVFTITQSGCATISPTSQIFLANGGGGTVTVAGTAGCNWTASSAMSWVTITSATSGSGNGTVNFSVAANTSANSRSGNLAIAGQSFIVTQAGNCPTTPIIPGQIINGSLSASDCRTSLRSGQPFVDRYTFNGTESQVVTILHYTEAFDSYLFLIGPDGRVVAEDDDGGLGSSAQIRSGGYFQLPATGVYIIEATSYSGGDVGNYSLYLGLGSANCSYNASISPSSSFSASGATGALSINTVTGCNWQVASSVPWLVWGAPTSGTGNGTVSFTVSPNPDSSRRSGIVIAGPVVLGVTQNGNPLACPASPIAAGQTIQGTLSAGDCPSSFRNQTLSDHYSFSATAGQRIAVTMRSSAFDSLLYLVRPDGTLLGSDDDSDGGLNARFPSTGFFQIPATGTYVIEATTLFSNSTGAYSVSLEQLAADCVFAINPARQTLDSSASAGSVNVLVPSGCPWRAVSQTSWLTVSPDSGAGNGVVRFNAAANTGTASRTGQIRIAGEFLTITQLGSNPVATVSAAGFMPTGSLAPESIVASFGSGLATMTRSAETLPLPTELAGTRVTVRDIANVERLASLFFVSEGQVNFVIPAGTAIGSAMVTIVNQNGRVSTGTVIIAAIAPALFSANSTGQDVALGVLLRVSADGTQTYEPIARLDSATNRFVAVPIDFGATDDRLYLSLFGTGFRRITNMAGLAVQIGGVNSRVVYAGAQGDLIGVDQLNVELDRSLANRGEVNLTLTVNGLSSNTVKVNFK